MIALFYTEQILWASLGAAALFLVLLAGANAAGVRNPLVYGLLGIALWVAFLKSGVHATIAGVLLAMTIPATTRMDCTEFLNQSRSVLAQFKDADHGEGKSGRRPSDKRHCILWKKPASRCKPPCNGWSMAYFRGCRSSSCRIRSCQWRRGAGRRRRWGAPSGFLRC